jgi:hypothetical protein
MGMDKRLEEQLERVRRLSERVAQIHEQLAENTELINRDRGLATGSPLHQVRDFRHHSNGRDAARGVAAERPRRKRTR